MSLYNVPDDLPSEFAEACLGLAEPKLRAELDTVQIDAPDKIAPFALAFAAQVPNRAETPMNRGVGRIVFIYDQSQSETWGSNMRVIAYAKSPYENEMALEDDYANFCWELLTRSLARNQVRYSHEAGTVTKMTATGMGSLSDEKVGSEVEIRASWSPTDLDLGAHFAAWQDLVAGLAGFSVEGETIIQLKKAQ